MMGGGFRIECVSSTGDPSLINVGSDIVMQSTEIADYEVRYQNSFLTLNVGQDMTLFSSSGADGGWQPLGAGGVFNVGRDFLIQAVGGGNVVVASGTDFQVNTGNNLTLLCANGAGALIAANGFLETNVGQDLFIENSFSSPVFPGAALAGLAGLEILSGGSVELGNRGELFVGAGSVQVIADQDIINPSC